MNAADLERSARLQRVDALLADGREHSTWEIAVGAQVCAVNSVIAELRANGRQIRCTRRGRRWYYQAELPEKRAAGALSWRRRSAAV